MPLPSHQTSLLTALRQLALWTVFSAVLFFPTTTFASMPVSLTLKAGDYQEELSANDITRFMRLDTRLVSDPRYRSEIEDTAACPAQNFYCEFSLSLDRRFALKTALVSTVDPEALQIFTAALAQRAAQEPVDVKFGVSAGTVVIAEPEKNGQRLKEKESLALLKQAFTPAQHAALTLDLPTEITPPKLVGADRERLGLKELVGEGRSNFKGSPKNRVYNIKRSLQQFENVVIMPGEEFSFVDYLGEVDGENGYLPELVIKNNQTTPEFGGGICQVSTTVFRAAIYSGLKISERRQHAYPVKYYEPIGMDATIYIPKPDLAFINNTPGALLIQSSIENETELVFRFYGTKDGRTVTVDGPRVLERNPDGSMKTVFTQFVSDAKGANMITDTFWSNYKSPSLYPKTGAGQVYTEKPASWSEKQWEEYKKIRP